MDSPTPQDDGFPALNARAIGRALDELREEIGATSGRMSSAMREVHPSHAEGAANLGHYMALRQHDLRHLQGALQGLGLSSLGRAEGDVAGTLDRVRQALDALTQAGAEPGFVPSPKNRLDQHTDALFGPGAEPNRVRIMVTASAEMAGNPDELRALVAAGMDLLRINCAHDGPETWRALARTARAAASEQGRTCRILMDLAGPKLRTGAVEDGPRVRSWHPKRTLTGQVLTPARIWLGMGEPPGPVDCVLPLEDGARLDLVREGGQVRLTDLRGRPRCLQVLQVLDEGLLLSCENSAWVGPETLVKDLREGRPGVTLARTGAIPALPGSVFLQVDDVLILRADTAPGHSARDGQPASIPCTLPEVIGAVRVGDPVRFDDGRIDAVVEELLPDALRLRITRTREGGAHLKADKGINLPETWLPVPALTAYDLRCLDEVVELADLVGLSFVREPADVRLLHEALAGRGRSDLGVVLKIETRLGFQNLPALLLEGMRIPRIGVMIARGDLAVECGFERLAEIQEEILWVCEAAHVPAIWATQVLDTLARKGVATRAEITDAAAGQRAECVMLNKGPHAVEAVRALDDILHRMANHQRKKTAMLRRLRSLGAV